MQNDYYRILGLSRQTTAQEIQEAFERLLQQAPPDAQELRRSLSEAFSVLGEESQRAAYDEYLHGFDDSGHESGPAAPVLEHDLEIDFEGSFFGTQADFEVVSPELCGACGGRGHEPGTAPAACPLCGGTGRLTFVRGGVRVSATCDQCAGNGAVIRDLCKPCGGTGRVSTPRRVSVSVPPGAEDGQMLRVKGEGAPFPAGSGETRRGDLAVWLHVRPHPLFSRLGRDLVCETPVPAVTAMLGGEILVPTMAGPVKVRVPVGTISGQVLTVPGQGFTRPLQATGDLVVKIAVEVPVSLTKRQKELLAEFSSEDGHGPQRPRTSFWAKVREIFR